MEWINACEYTSIYYTKCAGTLYSLCWKKNCFFFFFFNLLLTLWVPYFFRVTIFSSLIFFFLIFAYRKMNVTSKNWWKFVFLLLNFFSLLSFFAFVVVSQELNLIYFLSCFLTKKNSCVYQETTNKHRTLFSSNNEGNKRASKIVKKTCNLLPALKLTDSPVFVLCLYTFIESWVCTYIRCIDCTKHTYTRSYELKI